jgi:Carboxypeptidase regulatory-like domain
MIKSLAFILFMLVLAVEIGIAQTKTDCSNYLNYENKNQVDPKPLRLSIVLGSVEDVQGVSIPDVCLAIFTESGKLVTQVTSDKNGKFAFSAVPAGEYRLVAKYSPFCTANVPIEVIEKDKRGKSKQRKVVVHMKPAGIDECSFGELK